MIVIFGGRSGNNKSLDDTWGNFGLTKVSGNIEMADGTGLKLLIYQARL